MKKLLWLGLRLVLVGMLLLQATSVALADDDEVEFEAELTGAAEVPGPGDPDGEGEAEIEIENDYTRICFELEVEDIDPATAAHIHAGAAGVAGPVVVGLAAPTNGESEGCVDVEREVGLAIAQNPAQYYVNVHNAAFPGGAVRGQLEIDD